MLRRIAIALDSESVIINPKLVRVTAARGLVEKTVTIAKTRSEILKGQGDSACLSTSTNSICFALMTSAIAKGRIQRLDIREAKAVPGVLDILTYENTTELKPLKFGAAGGGSTSIQSLGPDIAHAGQIIAVVLADTFEGAREAARRVRVDYAAAPLGELRTPACTRRPFIASRLDMHLADASALRMTRAIAAALCSAVVTR